MKIVIEKEYYPFLEWKHKTVPLTYNFEAYFNPNRIIGECEIEDDKENKQYIGELRFYNTEYTKNIKQKIRGMFPAIGGRVISRDSSGKITKVILQEVSIVHENVDPNIPPINVTE